MASPRPVPPPQPLVAVTVVTRDHIAEGIAGAVVTAHAGTAPRVLSVWASDAATCGEPSEGLPLGPETSLAAGVGIQRAVSAVLPRAGEWRVCARLAGPRVVQGGSGVAVRPRAPGDPPPGTPYPALVPAIQATVVPGEARALEPLIAAAHAALIEARLPRPGAWLVCAGLAGAPPASASVTVRASRWALRVPGAVTTVGRQVRLRIAGRTERHPVTRRRVVLSGGTCPAAPPPRSRADLVGRNLQSRAGILVRLVRFTPRAPGRVRVCAWPVSTTGPEIMARAGGRVVVRARPGDGSRPPVRVTPRP